MHLSVWPFLLISICIILKPSTNSYTLTALVLHHTVTPLPHIPAQPVSPCISAFMISPLVCSHRLSYYHIDISIMSRAWCPCITVITVIHPCFSSAIILSRRALQIITAPCPDITVSAVTVLVCFHRLLYYYTDPGRWAQPNTIESLYHLCIIGNCFLSLSSSIFSPRVYFLITYRSVTRTYRIWAQTITTVTLYQRLPRRFIPIMYHTMELTVRTESTPLCLDHSNGPHTCSAFTSWFTSTACIRL